MVITLLQILQPEIPTAPSIANFLPFGPVARDFSFVGDEEITGLKNLPVSFI